MLVASAIKFGEIEAVFGSYYSSDEMPLCPRCYKKNHYCSDAMRGKKCACSKEERCECKPINRVAVFPRPCPCPEKKCKELWAEGTKDEKEDDDTDYIVQHCECHDISHGKTSNHCALCDKWVCQDCAQQKELPEEIEDDNDSLLQSEETVCKECRQRWLEFVEIQLERRMRTAQNGLLVVRGLLTKSH